MRQGLTISFEQTPDGDWEVHVSGKLCNVPVEVVTEALTSIVSHELERHEEFLEACRRYRDN